MKKFNLELLQSIIKTDFLLLENYKQKTSKLINLGSDKNLNVLDILELHACLKQFIRLLQFIKKKKTDLHLLNINTQYLKILKIFFLKNQKFLSNSIIIREDFVKKVQEINYFNFYIFLNKKNNLKETFLIYEFNSYFEKFNKGTYKMFNSLNSFKKIIFIAAIIQNVLKISKKNINS